MLKLIFFLTLFSALFLFIRLFAVRFVSAQTMYRLWIAFPACILLYCFGALVLRIKSRNLLTIQVCVNKNILLNKIVTIIWITISAFLIFKNCTLAHRFNDYLKQIRTYSRSFRIRFKGLPRVKSESTYKIYDINSPVFACSFGKKIYMNHKMKELEPMIVGAITRHELKHCLNNDYLWNIVRMLISSLFWFNPLIILACKLSEEDMEASCDEFALINATNQLRKKYAYTLASVAKERPQYFAPGYSNHIYSLHNRINRFTCSNSQTKANIYFIFLVILAFIVSLQLIPQIQYLAVSNPGSVNAFVIECKYR